MVTIRKVEIAEADTLLAYSKKTFYEFFAHLNDPVHMEAYSSVAFTPQCILDQLTNPDSEFYFALYEDNIVCYIKLNFNNAQTEYKDKNALEIERIYVSGEHHGKAHSASLTVRFLLLTLLVTNSSNMYGLAFGEHNYKAIGFYEHNGFKLCGSHEFLLGEDKQTDLLMRKEPYRRLIKLFFECLRITADPYPKNSFLILFRARTTCLMWALEIVCLIYLDISNFLVTNLNDLKVKLSNNFDPNTSPLKSHKIILREVYEV